jgi:hypothetical protein
MDLQHYAPYTWEFCLLFSFHVEKLTIIIDCRRYAKYLDIYETAFLFTSSHTVSYIHQLSTFKSLFPHLK